MEMPRPTAEHQRLAAFAGSWVGNETFFPSPMSPEGGKAKARVECRSDLDGFCVITDYVETRDGAVSFRGHGVMSWDPKQQNYIWLWADTMGGMPCEVTRGHWIGNTLVFQNRSEMGYHRYSYVFNADGSHDFKMEFSQDGGTWSQFMLAHYVKAAPKKGAAKKAAPKKKSKAAAKPGKAKKAKKSKGGKKKKGKKR
jgi:hypothetical protein